MNLRGLRRRALKSVAWSVAHPWAKHFVQVGEYRRRKSFMVFIEPDPEKERAEFVRQLMERHPLQPGDPEPTRGEIGVIDSFRFVLS